MVVSRRWHGMNEGPVTALPFSKPAVPLSTIRGRSSSLPCRLNERPLSQNPRPKADRPLFTTRFQVGYPNTAQEPPPRPQAFYVGLDAVAGLLQTRQNLALNSGIKHSSWMQFAAPPCGQQPPVMAS